MNTHKKAYGESVIHYLESLADSGGSSKRKAA